MGDILAIRRKDGKCSYLARIRRIGEKKLTKTFRRKTDAEKWIAVMESEIFKGNGLPRPNPHTVRETIERYEIDILLDKKESTQAVEAPRLKFWKEYFGDKRLSDINSDCLLRARSYIESTPIPRNGWKRQVQKRGPATANRYMALLRHVFSVAVRDWEWIDKNPVSRIRPLKEPRGRERFLTDNELKVIVKGLDTHSRKEFVLIVQIALVTGCRRSNAEDLRWEHVDFEGLTVTFPDTKNNRTHVAPITADLAEELKEYRVETGAPIEGPVFGSEEGSKFETIDIKQVWRRFVKDLASRCPSLAGLRFHDLRHAVASYLAKQNVSLSHIGKLLGHRSLESTKRYAHLTVDDVVPQVEALGARLRRVK